MRHILGTHHLKKALEAEGFQLPDHCGEVRLVMDVNRPFVLQYDVFVDEDQLVKVGKALARIGEESKAQYEQYLEGQRKARCRT